MMPNIRKPKFRKNTYGIPEMISGPQMWNWTEDELHEAYTDYVKYRKSSAEERRMGKEVDEVFAKSELFYNIFGLSEEDLEEELVSELKETDKDILDFDSFKKKMLGGKAIQNDLIANIREILELPENFKALVTPNDTSILDPFAEELRDAALEYDPLEVHNGEVRTAMVKGKPKKVISPTRVLEVRYNLYKHSSNNIGKQTLGIGAVDNTYNILFNRIGAHMNPTVPKYILDTKAQGKKVIKLPIQRLYNRLFTCRIIQLTLMGRKLFHCRIPLMHMMNTAFLILSIR
jgi:hypothetical protein